MLRHADLSRGTLLRTVQPARKPLWEALLLTFLAFLPAFARPPAKPQQGLVVSAGGSVQLKGSAGVRWSLAPGSIGSIDPDGTYHAPASVAAKNVLAGCQLLPNNHIFNTRIDDLPAAANSQELMSLIPKSAIGYYPAWGTNIADASTPKEKMHFLYTPQNDGVYEMVPWPFLKQENGVFSDPKAGDDRHVLTIDRDSCQVFEFYSTYSAGLNPNCPTCTGQSGVQYASMSPALPTGGVDAASLLLGPLTLRLDEIESGSVQHALRVTLKNSIIAPHFVWPARTNAGAWGKIPYGTRFRLKAEYDVSHFSPMAQVLLRQLKEYGLILADGGANWEVDVSTDVTEDPKVQAAMREIGARGPRSSDFEIVDEASFVVSGNSGLVNANSPYAKPDMYAIAIESNATDPSHGKRIGIGVQAVTVGVPDPAIWVQSGVTKRLKAWVHGASDKSVRWSVSPALGSVTADGVYTAPQVSKPTYALLKAQSAADPNAKTTVGLTIMPPGPIRIDVGNATRAANAPNRLAPDYGPDSEGQMWWREQAGEYSWGVVHDEPGGWPPAKDIGLYYTSRYSLGDMIYRFSVPNGNYKVSILIAQTDCPSHAKFDPRNMRPIKLEAQGQIVADNFDWGQSIDYTCHVPTSVAIPAKVTDGDLYFALRRVSTKQSKGVPLLNAFSIERDNSPPHISIDPAGPVDVTMGHKVQFNAVGWYMSNSVAWSIVKGPGTISQKGLYEAPSSPPSGDQITVVQAKSTVNPKMAVTAELKFGFGSLVVSPGSGSLARSLSRKFTASINGTPYNNVNWSVSPALGTITSDGVFTAPDSLAQDTKVTVKAESRDDPSKSATATLDLNAALPAIRINCGDIGAFKDAHGNVWAADHGASGGMVNSDRKPIAGASPDMLPLYQSSRYCYPDQRFNYTFQVPNGRYAVTLKFADYSWNNAGHYIFDVLLNGQKVLNKFDLQVGYPPKTAIDKRFETTVSNKSIRIDFVAHGAAAIINGIEIVYLGQ